MITANREGCILADWGLLPIVIMDYSGSSLPTSSEIQEFLLDDYHVKGSYNSLLLWLINKNLNTMGNSITFGGFRIYVNKDFNLETLADFYPYVTFQYLDTSGETEIWRDLVGLWYGGYAPQIGSDVDSRYPYIMVLHSLNDNSISFVRTYQDYSSSITWMAPVNIGVGTQWSNTMGVHGTTSQYSDWLRLYYDPTNDPYNYDPSDPTSTDGQASGTGGGSGTYGWHGEPVLIPRLPDIDAVDTGFITIFNPSLSQLKNLADYMWNSSLFDIETWQKCFANPMDAILGLSIVPVNVPNGGARTVTVGNINTGISMTKASKQYVSVSCGTLKIDEYWGAYLDYEPYTHAEIYLPYCGIHPISIDEIMGKNVSVDYHVDILSGACCCYVSVNGGVLYSFVGQCSSSIPISGNDFTQMINGVMSIAGSIGTMVATGGMTAPTFPQIAGNAINNMKPTIEKSGSLSGTGGLLAVQKPYIIMTRPNQSVPARQNEFKGYPSNITATFSSLSGYTEVESVHLENIPATDAEMSEIESLLKGGVIF